MSEIKDRGYQCAVAEDVFNRLAGGGISGSSSGVADWAKDSRVLVASGKISEQETTDGSVTVPLKADLVDLAKYLFYFNKGAANELVDIATYKSDSGRFDFSGSVAQERFTANVNPDNPGFIRVFDMGSNVEFEVYETRYIIVKDLKIPDYATSGSFRVENKLVDGLPIHFEYGPDITSGTLIKEGDAYVDGDSYFGIKFKFGPSLYENPNERSIPSVTLYQEITEAPVVIPAVNLGGTWETITFTTSGGETVTKTILVKNE